MTGRLVAAVDLGTSSGRMMVGRVAPDVLHSLAVAYAQTVRAAMDIGQFEPRSTAVRRGH